MWLVDYMLPHIVPVNTGSGDRHFISRIITAPTHTERVKLLNQPDDYIFDFKAGTGAGEAHGKGGRSVSATALTMPALIGNGASMTVAFLGPCGMNTAHVHNRATKLNIVIKGRLVTSFVVENGAKPIANTMDTFQMTVFPQCAIHQELIPDCKDAVFVAAFDNANPVSLPETREWIEKAALRGHKIYIIVGIQTFIDARIVQKLARGRQAGGQAATAAMPFADLVDPAIREHQNAESDQLWVLAPDEQVWSLQYRKVRTRWLSSRPLEPLQLSETRRWSCMEGDI
ncbi:hypothetical protein HZS61_008717 [Fusarium oxysporum f. sp. conglutinans]|uniref:Cupin type-1 domain-containing protein n=1 Tax=Fusarium oxysporum f. sp. conglutinans TaxID=100902 RepID=A0A8H6H3D3_FUSOX|nr:hypothetical protein HZS61_008717 [Fusarium oxysporum f. sp. conglutinans]